VVVYEVEEEAEKVVEVIKVRGTKISGTDDETATICSGANAINWQLFTKI
jgi:hypothetical protein